jgi:hypothetical protein
MRIFKWIPMLVLTPALGAGVPPVEQAAVAVLVLPPTLSYEALHNEAPLSATPFGAAAVAADVKAVAIRSAQASSLELAPDADAGADGLSAALLRRQIPEDAKSALAKLADSDERAAVLATVLRVKVGPGGSWNSYTGAITSGMSQTRLQAALVHCRSARVLWKNEVLLREIPRVGDKDYAKALAALFAGLAVPKE